MMRLKSFIKGHKRRTNLQAGKKAAQMPRKQDNLEILIKTWTFPMNSKLIWRMIKIHI